MRHYFPLLTIVVIVLLVCLSPIMFEEYVDYKEEVLSYEATMFCGREVTIFGSSYHFWKGSAVFSCNYTREKTYTINDETYEIREL